MKKKLIGLLALSLVLSGCLPNLSTPKSGSGEENQFIKDDIVKGFPGVPLYPDAKIIESYFKDGVYGASVISSDDLSKVSDFYSTSLAALGWESDVKQVNDHNFVFKIKNEQYSGEIIVNTAADNKQTAITYSLDPR